MIIVETPIFTKRVTGVMGVEDYRLLQSELVLRPESGKIIPGSGGLRKLRWTGSGRGKRGGSRLIYYYMRDDKIIMMLFIYAKNETEDLTKDQIKVLRSIVEEELK